MCRGANLTVYCIFHGVSYSILDYILYYVFVLGKFGISDLVICK